MPRSAAFTRIKADVLTLVRQVPRGRVTTYGAIGGCLDVMARHVGYILGQLTDEEAADVPWHRVVAEPGRVSIPHPAARREQIARLKGEGVAVDSRGHVADFEETFYVPQYGKPARTAAVKRATKPARQAAAKPAATAPAPRKRPAKTRRPRG